MGGVEHAQPTFIVSKKGVTVMHITTLGIDLATIVFQLFWAIARAPGAQQVTDPRGIIGSR